jgi:hypothetical protein
MKKFLGGFLLGSLTLAALSAYATIRRLHQNGQTYNEWVEANTDYLASRERRDAHNRERNESAGMAADGLRTMP